MIGFDFYVYLYYYRCMESQAELAMPQLGNPTDISAQPNKSSKRSLLSIELIALGVIVLIAIIVYGSDLFSVNRFSPTISSTPSISQSTILSATLAQSEGTVEIYKTDDTGNQAWVRVDNLSSLKQGDSLRTKTGAKALVTIEDGSVIRLNENTEITLTSLKSTLVIVTQTTGETYHRVDINPTRQYLVITGDVEIKALGTIFNVKTISPEETEVKVIKNSVEVVSADQSQLTQAASGEKVTAVSAETGNTQVKSIIRGEEFDTPWFAYLVTEELKDVTDLGIFTSEKAPALEITQPTNGLTTTDSTVSIKGATSLNATVKVNDVVVAINGGVFEKVVDLVVGSNQFTVKAYAPSGAKTVVSLTVNRTNPGPIPTGTPTPTPIRDFTITSVSSPKAGQATVNWKFEGYDLGKGFKVTFSKNSNPEYPTRDSDFATLVDNSARTVTFEGAGLTEGGTFHVRVCRYIEITTGSYCDLYTADTTVSVSPSDWGMQAILLTVGSQSNRTINLNWEVSGTGKASLGYKIVWSNSLNPTYPKNQNSYRPAPSVWDQILGFLGIHTAIYAETVDTTWGYVYLTDPNARSTSITLAPQYPAGTWYFRVCRYRDGYCDVYSNQVEVTVN